MLLYSYWARAIQHCQDDEGRPYRLIAYAGSDESASAAQQAAYKQLHQRCQRLEAGESLRQYPSGTAPLREPVVQRLVDDLDGQLIGAVTRNRYGSRVLNTRGIMFLDVDRADLAARRPRPGGLARLRQFFQRLTGQLPPTAPPEQQPEAYLLSRLHAWLAQHPDWNFRLYRTRAGYRVLATHAPVAPDAPLADAIFRFLPVDATYRWLCASQHCYRARLDPKPWRIGLARPAHAFPFDTAAQAAEQAEWEAAFTARRQRYSVCELVGSYGSGRVCPEARAVVVLHDEACLGGRPLA